MTKKNSHRRITFFNARLTSTISISLVLFLLGLVVLIGLFTNRLSSHVRENFSFSVVLSNDIKDSQILNIQKQLNAAPFVKSTTYISKEQAAKELEAELGGNPEDFLGYNPLLPSIEVKLKAEYANNDSISMIETRIKQGSNVRDVMYQKDLLQLVNHNIKTIGIMLFTLSLIFMVISFALISNTIQLSVYSKRFLIHTMQLVGATGSFIRTPFVRSNIISGVAAAVIAMLLLSGFLYYLTKSITDFGSLINMEMLLIVFASMLVSGIVISVTATWFAINKYLNMKIDNLYYI